MLGPVVEIALMRLNRRVSRQFAFESCGIAIAFIRYSRESKVHVVSGSDTETVRRRDVFTHQR